VWKAKEQQQASKKGGREGGKEVGEKKVSEAERRLELVREIEKVRKRREEREKEQEEMERLRAEEARLREAGNYEEWERKEEEFHLEQARVRSKVRTQGREGREGNEEGGMGERWGCGGG
jgi:type IV secretory pathway VirD2 relaxase